MNSKTAQLTENGTEIVRLFARFALAGVYCEWREEFRKHAFFLNLVGPACLTHVG